MTATLDCLRRLVSGCLLAAPVVGLVVGLAVGLVGILAPLAGPAAAAGPQVMDVRLGVHPDRTRLVLDLSGPVPFRIFTLVEPRRVVVDLP
ncbi:MAG: AMIN domain-containing protein, partial [Alphaproteobacteria bacterium]